MALYSKKELKIERSRGLVLSDEDNKNWDKIGEPIHWTNEEFEKWLSTKSWADDIKDQHRTRFKGVIYITPNSISYT